MQNTIQVVLFGLNSTQISQASFAMKDLCRECQLVLKPNADLLLEAIHKTMNSGNVDQSDEIRFMYSIGRLMSMLPPARILHWLNLFASPCFVELNEILQSQQVSVDGDVMHIPKIFIV